METKMKLPTIGHIGYIVEDIDNNIKLYKNILNINDFYIYNFKPMRAWVDAEEIYDCKMKIAMGVMENGIKIEFIQPISGATTPHMIFVKKKGSNIHHIAFHVKNYEDWRSYYKEKLNARIIFEAEAEDEVIGYRRSFYSRVANTDGVIEISEIPWKRK